MEKFSRRNQEAEDMAQAAEMKGLIQQIGWPLFPGEQVVFRWERAARKLGISKRTAKSYWYGERPRIPSSDMDRARRLTGNPVEKEAVNELQKLRERIARLETALAVQDPDFHSPMVDALRQWSGNQDRTLD